MERLGARRKLLVKHRFEQPHMIKMPLFELAPFVQVRAGRLAFGSPHGAPAVAIGATKSGERAHSIAEVGPGRDARSSVAEQSFGARDATLCDRTRRLMFARGNQPLADRLETL